MAVPHEGTKMNLTFNSLRFVLIFLLSILAYPISAETGPSAFVKTNRADLVDKVRDKGEIKIIVGLQVLSANVALAANLSAAALQKRMNDIANA